MKSLKIQKQIFAACDREPSKGEVAKQQNNDRLYLLLQTICSTDIRVSEVRFVTVEAVEHGIDEISCKDKQRTALLPQQLCHILKQYIRQ